VEVNMPNGSRMYRMALLVVVVSIALPGCVLKEKYDLALADLAASEEEAGSLSEQLGRCRGDLGRVQNDLAACDERAGGLARERDGLLAETTSLRDALAKTGAETAMLEQNLQEANQALEQMRARQAEAEERNRIYRQLLDRFKEMIDAGTLDVAIERGRIVIKMKQDILFESGSARVGKDGKETLLEVSSALAEFPDRIFQVEGHTDNVPINSDRFPSNWELSTARAVSVVKILIEGGVAPTNLSGAGYGEFQPRADNDTPENKALNRRIEIVMLPSLQALPDPDQVRERSPKKGRG